VRILALPRDPNPYQRLLYAEAAARGARVRYVGDATPSRTLNLLLLPLELAVSRARGWRVLHVHWVFGFQLPGAARVPLLRRAAQAWFVAVLAWARLVGLRVAWTAHNALPHERVFHDDAAARRALVRASELVVLHSPATLDALAQIGAVPRRTTVAPPGPFAPPVDPSTLRAPGDGPRRFAFFGKVIAYKGVEELLAVARQLELELTVAGACTDDGLRGRLEAAAGERTTLRLEHVPDAELTALLAASDVVVLPFRRVTTSASALFAMAHGRVVVLPDLPAFAELPADAVVRYDGTIEDLVRELGELRDAPAERLQAIGRRAAEAANETSWGESAQRMLDAMAAGTISTSAANARTDTGMVA
jgi:glycosyltransferase involved in cell wall biosynthesis